MVIAKFICEAADVDPDTKHTMVKMRPDYPKDGDPNHPNRKFWEATPAGSLEMTITNAGAGSAFLPGQVYTVTFGPDEG